MSVATAKKTRSTARKWVTVAVNALEEVLDSTESDKHDVEGALEDLSERFAALNQAQGAVEELLPEEEVDADLAQAGIIATKVQKARKDGARRLEKIMGDSDSMSESGSHVSKAQAVRLPKLELPKFKGDFVEWQTFWDKFKATIDASDLPEVTKFTYLQSLLEGEAKKVVEGLTLTGKNYQTACDLLEGRFGRRELIVFSHIQSLLTLMPDSKGSKLDQLKGIQDQVLVHVRSLETMDVAGTTCGIFLTPLILSRLPTDVRLEWARAGEGKESDLKHLLDFLRSEIERRQRAQSFQLPSPGEVGERKRQPSRTPAASALQTSSGPDCGFCHQRHATAKCWAVHKLSLKERDQRIMKAGLCFKCLRSGHIARRCSARCSRCRRGHHELCCTDTVDQNDTPNETEVKLVTEPAQDGVTICANSSLMGHGTVQATTRVVLQTIEVEIVGPRGVTQATLLFDSGSDRTYITRKVSQNLGLKWVGATELRYAVFGGGRSSNVRRDAYEFKVRGKGRAPVSLRAVEVPVICAPLSRPRVSIDAHGAFGDLGLTEQYAREGEVQIGILVGLDFYWDLVKGDTRRMPGGDLVAQETVFGWVLSGKVNGGSSGSLSPQLLCLNDVPEAVVRKFWDLESLGIGPQETEVGPGKVLGDFNESIQHKDGRYEVCLPWKEGKALPQLVENERLATFRLQRLSRKLDRDPSLKTRYNGALRDMEASGVIEEVPPSEVASPYPVFYLPHRPVVKESSSTTKVRPVFDASAKGSNNVSLNDCLEVGPPLIPSLVEILVRFRRWKVALTADLTKAFLQVGLQKKEQDVHRFLWNDGGSVRKMRFLRVTFGNKASPFLLNATIRYHLSKYPPSVVIQELSENLYVDDWLTGANTEAEACKMFAEAKSVMDQAGMSLAKWTSNSRTISEKVLGSADGIPVEGVKVLGVRWRPAEDSFSFDGVPLPADIQTTKRVVLSFLARTFDPLGFATPFLMIAKVLFQRLWQEGLGWDETVPDELHLAFSNWLAGFEMLRRWEIPRCYSPSMWDDSTRVELHSFGDASERGYGAVVYLRFLYPDGTFATSFVVSKARVAPLKKVTLPRLELLGSLLAARLLKFVRSALKLPADIDYKCWTDSTAALGWIKADSYKWKQFVANRVSEIQELTEPSHWFHCPGLDNPADLTTRGIDAKVLVTSDLWLHGPTWLLGPEEGFPAGHSVRKQDDEVSLSVTSEIALISVETGVKHPPVKVFDVERWGTFTKAMRVVAWVLRFMHNVRLPKEQRKYDDFSFEELSEAKRALFRQSQDQAFHTEEKTLKQGGTVLKGSPLFRLTPFIDPDGLLRVGGRLQESELSYEEKHPIILPKDPTTRLVVRFQHKLLKHAGVSLLLTSLRDSYWILGLRRLAKAVKKECVQCQRLDAKACNEVGAPLPSLRVSEAPPFTVTGVDHAGPLFCIDFPRQKLYICLFTCAVIRAVHLELVDSLTMRDFILAFKRFAARRGLPSVIYSDNAKTFKGSEVRLQALYGSSCPKWKYIAPRSPWWGGWWERLVRTVKQALKRSLGTSCLTRAELETTLHEVEGCVNSRPLTFVGDEVHYKRPLTPNHFLTARGASFQESVLEDPESVTPESLTLREQMYQERLDKFWEIWRGDYLRNLPQCVPQFQSKGSLDIGSVVLVREDKVPRLKWEWGRVVRLFPGRDDKVRSVELKTPRGSIVRPIQRLHVLEFLSPSPGQVPVEECSKNATTKNDEGVVNPEPVPDGVTRSGRRIKPVNRLDL